ncbi:MAG TPA: DHA2 family efflux MFS transporter permease subunit, partial [Chloroflexota bacterium]|nr:DHA2 family efflux MFS transporter permease subunit [Chloroflexota bacterium]
MLHRVPYRYLVAAAFVVALFIDVLDATIVNVALPTLGRELSLGNDSLEWVVTAYLLSLAVFIPASGWLGDRFGTRCMFLLALSIFLLGSALCGLAWSGGALIGFRVLQGMGGGMLVPVGTTMVVRAFPLDQRARGSAIIGIPAVLAPVLGPLLGGLLVDTVGWRWIFWANLPIGLAGLSFAALVLREHRESAPGRFDLPGFLTAALALMLGLFALSRVPAEGWLSPLVVVCGLAALACAGVLVVVERRRAGPMLDLRLLQEAIFGATNLTHVFATASLVGMLFLLPLYLQQLRGLSALESGLTSFPQALGLLAAMPLVSILFARVSARSLITAALLGTTATAIALALAPMDVDLWTLRAILFLRGVSFALALLPLQTAAFSTITSTQTGRASALFNMLR